MARYHQTNYGNYQIVFFAIDTSVNIVEGFTAESTATRTADKTVRMVKVAHSLAGLACASNFLTTRMADT